VIRAERGFGRSHAHLRPFGQCVAGLSDARAAVENCFRDRAVESQARCATDVDRPNYAACCAPARSASEASFPKYRSSSLGSVARQID
jgi:hypothetical protein